jgi:hypothetical protein
MSRPVIASSLASGQGQRSRSTELMIMKESDVMGIVDSGATAGNES